MEKLGYESGSSKNSAELTPQVKIRRLSRLRKYARIFVVAGMVSGLPSGLKIVTERIVGHGQKGTIENIISLEKKEARVRAIYGDNFPYKLGQFYREQLAAKSRTVKIFDNVSGEKIEFETDKPWGEKETNKTPVTTIEPLQSKDGTIDKESLEKMTRTYPIGWVNNEIESIKQGTEEKKLNTRG